MLDVNENTQVTSEAMGTSGRMRAIAESFLIRSHQRTLADIIGLAKSDSKLCEIRECLADDAKRWSPEDDSIEGLIRTKQLPMTAFGLRTFGEIPVSGSWKPLFGGATRSLIFTAKGFEIMVVDADTWGGDARDWSFLRLPNEEVMAKDLQRLGVEAVAAIQHVKQIYEKVFKSNDAAKDG